MAVEDPLHVPLDLGGGRSSAVRQIQCDLADSLHGHGHGHARAGPMTDGAPGSAQPHGGDHDVPAHRPETTRSRSTPERSASCHVTRARRGWRPPTPRRPTCRSCRATTRGDCWTCTSLITTSAASKRTHRPLVSEGAQRQIHERCSGDPGHERRSARLRRLPPPTWCQAISNPVNPGWAEPTVSRPDG